MEKTYVVLLTLYPKEFKVAAKSKLEAYVRARAELKKLSPVTPVYKSEIVEELS